MGAQVATVHRRAWLGWQVSTAATVVLGLVAASVLSMAAPEQAGQPRLVRQFALQASIRAAALVSDRSGACVVLVDSARRVHFLYGARRRCVLQTCWLPAAAADYPALMLATKRAPDERFAEVVVLGWQPLKKLWRAGQDEPALPVAAYRRTATGVVADQPRPGRYLPAGELERLVRHQNRMYRLRSRSDGAGTQLVSQSRLGQTLKGDPLAIGDLDDDGSDEVLTAARLAAGEGYRCHLYRWVGHGLRRAWRVDVTATCTNGEELPRPVGYLVDLNHHGGAEMLLVDGQSGLIRLYSAD